METKDKVATLEVVKTVKDVFDNNIAEIKENITGKQDALVAGDNISITNNTISVITTGDAEQDNTKPITSAGVYVIVGNINTLLSKI